MSKRLRKFALRSLLEKESGREDCKLALLLNGINYAEQHMSTRSVRNNVATLDHRLPDTALLMQGVVCKSGLGVARDVLQAAQSATATWPPSRPKHHVSSMTRLKISKGCFIGPCFSDLPMQIGSKVSGYSAGAVLSVGFEHHALLAAGMHGESAKQIAEQCRRQCYADCRDARKQCNEECRVQNGEMHSRKCSVICKAVQKRCKAACRDAQQTMQCHPQSSAEDNAVLTAEMHGKQCTVNHRTVQQTKQGRL